MILYSCTEDQSWRFSEPVKCIKEPEQTASVGRKKCEIAWAMGSPGTVPRVYPNNMGKAWGRYVLLEIHYSNTKGVAGIVDESGFLLTYTAQLRPLVVCKLA
jgi:hypothetical protein